MRNNAAALLHDFSENSSLTLTSNQVQLDERPLANGAKAQYRAASSLRTRTVSLEQAGGLQRMTLRGHTGGVKKVLLTPGGVDIITSEAYLDPHICSLSGCMPAGRGPSLTADA